MVVVPAGTFIMGSSPAEIEALTEEHGDYFKNEGPQHEVTIPRPFAVGKFEVTNAQYVAFLNDVKRRGTEKEPWFETKNEDSSSQITGSVGAFAVESGKEDFPVVNVSWFGVEAYAKWLSEKTGKRYRLLSEAEWEYAARAGTTGPFSFEGPITTDKANYDGNYTYAGSPKGEYRQRTVPVDSFEPNAWGLYQVHGNVWEWVADCWKSSYADKPESLKASGGAWTTGDCDGRVLRGGSWFNNPRRLRSAYRFRYFRVSRYNYFGFRLARTLTP
jgi:formylglycine-generating enzyme required for sulfatase activity